MIELIQQENNLIGSLDEIEKLKTLDHARVLVASDSHNNFDILLDIIKNFGPSCNAFVFCGDGLSDIAHLYTLASKNEEIRKIIPPVIAFVSGNCDPSSYPLTLKTQLTAPLEQVLEVNNKKLLIVHGHREGVGYGLNKLGLKMKMHESLVSIFGHTHIAQEETIEGYKFINPGSCSSPRGGQPKSFAILTVEKNFTDTSFIKIEKEEYKIWIPY